MIRDMCQIFKFVMIFIVCAGSAGGLFADEQTSALGTKINASGIDFQLPTATAFVLTTENIENSCFDCQRSILEFDFKFGSIAELMNKNVLGVLNHESLSYGIDTSVSLASKNTDFEPSEEFNYSLGLSLSLSF